MLLAVMAVVTLPSKTAAGGNPPPPAATAMPPRPPSVSTYASLNLIEVHLH